MRANICYGKFDLLSVLEPKNSKFYQICLALKGLISSIDKNKKTKLSTKNIYFYSRKENFSIVSGSAMETDYI